MPQANGPAEVMLDNSGSDNSRGESRRVADMQKELQQYRQVVQSQSQQIETLKASGSGQLSKEEMKRAMEKIIAMEVEHRTRQFVAQQPS